MPFINKIDIKKIFNTKSDIVIWSIVVLLALIGLVAIYSSTGALAYREKDGHAEVYLFMQIILIAVGFFLMYVAQSINYLYYKKLAGIFLFIGIVLLAYTLFFGVTVNKGSRWIAIPIVNVTFQASDVAKLALFIYLASELSKMQKIQSDVWTVILRIFLPVFIVCGLIAPANMSTALVIAASCGMLFFIGRIKMTYLLVLGVSLIIILVSSFFFSERAQTWKNRIANFSSQTENEDDFQVKQAKIAIVKGNWFGKGPGNSTQRNFLPNSFSDFIFSIIIEEYGLLIGGVGLIFLYLFFLWRAIRIFQKCPYAFGAFLAVGLSFTLVFQAFINMGVNVNLFPVTGLTLPLISKGGSSVWFSCLTIGVILSVSRFVNENEKKQLEKNHAA